MSSVFLFDNEEPRAQPSSLSYNLQPKIYNRSSKTATLSRRKPLGYGQVLLVQKRLNRLQESKPNENKNTQYTYGANFDTNFKTELSNFDIREPPTEFIKEKRRKTSAKNPNLTRRGIKRNLPYRLLYRMRPSIWKHRENDQLPPSNLIRLFGESSVPGVRDIALSQSFLRRIFWICSFLFFGFLALRDISQLASEYYTYPITVDVRLRDSRRLQFPAVTVCNLNIVRYSALCIANVSVIKESMIPRDLREKLCGIQPQAATTAAAVAAAAAAAAQQSQSSGTVSPPVTTASSLKTATTQSNELAKKSSKHPNNKNGPSTTTPSNRLKVNSQINNVTPTTTTADNSDGIDDINNYGTTISKHKLMNETANMTSNKLNDTDIGFDADNSTENNSETSTKMLLKPLAPIDIDAAPLEDLAPKRTKRRTQSTKNRLVDLLLNGTSSNTSGGNLSEITPLKLTGKGNEGTGSLVVENDIELTEREEKELQENLTNWLAVISNSNEKITKELGHQFEDLVLRCTIRSTNCTHASSFEHFFTPTEGNCFTFKSQKLRKTHVERIKDETSIAGVNYGLELVLNLEISEYLTGTTQIGAIIMISHPDEIGNSASEAIFVAPQQSTYIGLKMVNISRLPKPYPEECVDHWPAALIGRLTQNASYSQQACLKICLQRTIHLRCNCQSAMLPQLELNSTLKICDTRKKHTRNCVEEVMFQAEEKVSTCKCPPRCQVVNYDKTVSMTRWPTREDKVAFDRGRTNINFQNLAKVTVYFQTMTCQEVRQEKAYTTAKLFSSLGGILGMYVGFSFLSLFEILEIFVRRFWHFLTKKRNRFKAAVHTITATFAFNPKRSHKQQNDFIEHSQKEVQRIPNESRVEASVNRFANHFPYGPSREIN